MTAHEIDWERVDAIWLPTGWITSGDHGLVATFFADGQLARLAAMRAATCVAELVLEAGLPRGVETHHQGSGGTADWVTYRDGYAETFDAWSDNARPSPLAWRTWIERAIRAVTAAAPAR